MWLTGSILDAPAVPGLTFTAPWLMHHDMLLYLNIGRHMEGGGAHAHSKKLPYVHGRSEGRPQ